MADLAEAEGRSLKAGVAQVVVAIALAIAAGAMGIAGTALLLSAVWLAVEPMAGAAWASFVAGMVALLGAGGLAWLGRRASAGRS